jgi:hypothetical protein
MKENDPRELVRLGLAKLSNLHPSPIIKHLCDRLGVQAVVAIANDPGEKENDYDD